LWGKREEDLTVEFLALEEEPSYSHSSTADPEPQIEHVVENMLLPLVRCKAAAATVVVRPAEE
jgi:hypothetical protein